MFKGFNLKGFDGLIFEDKYRHEMMAHGRTVTASSASSVRQSLATIAQNQAVLDGAKIQDTWFPQVHADVFLSHSHRNEDLVLLLAGWLDYRFDLKAFADSAIWGYAADLLRIIDNEYCWQPQAERTVMSCATKPPAMCT